MNEISTISSMVPVSKTDVLRDAVSACLASELHEFLDVGRDFSTWFTQRVEKYEFVEGVDFAPQIGGAKKGSGGHNAKDYLISIAMAKELSMVENNDKGKEARKYFISCESAAKSLAKAAAISVPNFSNPAEAARAWADEYEAKLALELQMEKDRPLTDIGRAITGQETMSRRDWCALMKDEHDSTVKEKDLTRWLIDHKYCYKDTLTGETRAYAEHSSLLKLEYNVLNGFHRAMLMVTGEGIARLTGAVLADFPAPTEE
jgi:phage anti-repressor protein